MKNKKDKFEILKYFERKGIIKILEEWEVQYDSR